MKRLQFETKKKWIGFFFVVPWILGFIQFFLIPAIMSFRFSISNITVENGLNYEFVGLEQYKYLFYSDATFVTTVIQTTISSFTDMILIIIFSLFIATILVQNFRGRLLARAIFFLPVIIVSGAVMSSVSGNLSTGNGQFELNVLRNVLFNANLSTDMIDMLVDIMESLFEIVWRCGIPILIFMAGLQSISPSIKEAALVEGATGWEYFWKITFPLVTPMIQLNIIFSFVDSFTDFTNPIVKRIYELNQDMDYSFSAAISWTYFIIIFVMVLIVYLILNRNSMRSRQPGGEFN